jgi:hypothetical protein
LSKEKHGKGLERGACSCGGNEAVPGCRAGKRKGVQLGGLGAVRSQLGSLGAEDKYSLFLKSRGALRRGRSGE